MPLEYLSKELDVVFWSSEERPQLELWSWGLLACNFNYLEVDVGMEKNITVTESSCPFYNLAFVKGFMFNLQILLFLHKSSDFSYKDKNNHFHLFFDYC